MKSYQFTHRDHANSLYRSLTDDAFYETLENSIDKTNKNPHEGMLEYYDYSILEAEKYGKLILSEDHWGASIWSIPSVMSGSIYSAKKQFLLDYLGERSKDTYCTISENMDRYTKPLVPDDAWYLSIIGVDPEHQGKGLGLQLIEPVLKEADAAGVATYLETYTPRNNSFYERLGYIVSGTYHEPVTDAEYSVMVRKPVT